MKRSIKFSELTTFQKIQIISSIIPCVSTVFIMFVTMFEAKNRNVLITTWLKIMGIFFGFGIGAYLIANFLITGKYPFLQWVVITLILAIANIFFVDIQVELSQVNSNNLSNIPDENNVKTYKSPFFKKHKLIIGITVALIIAVFLIVKIVDVIKFAKGSDFVDINGVENFQLTVITREEIVSTLNDYTSFMSSSGGHGNQSSISDNRLEEDDYDIMRKSFGKIDGIMVLQATKIPQDTLTLNITSTVDSGNAEIIILIDGEYYCSVDVNQMQKITLENISNKTIIVKIGAESAKIRVEVERTY